MRRGLRWPLIALLAAATTLAHAGRHRSDDWSATSEETIEKTFSVSPSGGAVLDLDNFWGSIEVVGTAGRQIQVTVAKTILAADQAQLDRAKTEVTLDVTQDGDTVRFYVDGPFRCDEDCRDRTDCKGCWNLMRGRYYVVKMDF